MSYVDLVITIVWSSVSAIFVLLAFYGIHIAESEAKDTEGEVRRQANRPIANGVLVLALQQSSQTNLLKMMHRLALAHQTAGLLVGLISLAMLLYGNTAVDTPTTKINPIEEIFVPALFMFLLFAVCGVQLYLIRVTRSQRKARTDLITIEEGSGESVEKVKDEIIEKMEEFGRRPAEIEPGAVAPLKIKLDDDSNSDDEDT